MKGRAKQIKEEWRKINRSDKSLQSYAAHVMKKIERKKYTEWASWLVDVGIIIIIILWHVGVECIFEFSHPKYHIPKSPEAIRNLHEVQKHMIYRKSRLRPSI